MLIEVLPIEKLRAAKYNPRKQCSPGDPLYEEIKSSIEIHGLLIPLVWNKRTYRLVDGHQRLTVLADMGWDKIPVSVVDKDEIGEGAANLALDNIKGVNKIPDQKQILSELCGAVDPKAVGVPEREQEKLLVDTPIVGELTKITTGRLKGILRNPTSAFRTDLVDLARVFGRILAFLRTLAEAGYVAKFTTPEGRSVEALKAEQKFQDLLKEIA